MAIQDWIKDKMATREAYGKMLAELAGSHPEMCVLDADLSGSTKTAEFKKVCPERFFNVGVAEQDLMGTAAGLAADGMTVFASTFTMFAAGRAWEIIRQSIAYPHLNVKVCSTHAGITVGEDGASHQTVEDIACMRSIPGMTVLVPADGIQTARMVEYMIKNPGPVFMRLGRAGIERIFKNDYQFEMGKGHVLKEGSDVCLFTTGFVTKATLDAADLLEKEGVSATVVNLPSVKPIDKDLIIKMAGQHKILFSVEEHSIVGGFGSAIAEVLVENHPSKLVRLGMNDEFGQSGPASELLKFYKLDAAGIAGSVKSNV